MFNIIFRDERFKNSSTLLLLEIPPAERRKIITNLQIEDYSEGPFDDKLYGISSMWVFGKKVKGEEIYIKISMGYENSPVICISFHRSTSPMKYPFKK